MGHDYNLYLLSSFSEQLDISPHMSYSLFLEYLFLYLAIICQVYFTSWGSTTPRLPQTGQCPLWGWLLSALLSHCVINISCWLFLWDCSPADARRFIHMASSVPSHGRFHKRTKKMNVLRFQVRQPVWMLENPDLTLVTIGMYALEATRFFRGRVMIDTPDWMSCTMQKRTKVPEVLACFRRLHLLGVEIWGTK